MAFEVTILFALGAMLFWGVGDFLIQRTIRKIGNLQALFYIGIIGSILLLPFIIKDFYLLSSSQNLILLIILGAITFVSAIFNFEALKKGKLSVIEIILEIELPITIALGIIFFKERLAIHEIFLIVPIFIGIMLVSTNAPNLKGYFKRIERGVVLGILAAIGMGFTNFFTASASKSISPLMAIWFPWTIFTIVCLIILVTKKKVKTLIYNGVKFKSLIITTAVIDTLAWIFYAFALSLHDLSITTAITESYPVIALILGILINKEKIHKRQYLGAVLALVCSIALAFLA